MRGLLLTIICLVGHSVVSAGERPNILFAFADDWGRYASIYSQVDGEGTLNDFIDTPNFDRIAKSGVLFADAHVPAPSCTPCRSSLLSGQYFFKTDRAAFLQGAIWDAEKIASYPLILEEAGYHIGYTAKVWTPGTPRNAPYGEKRTEYKSKPQQINAFSQTADKLVGTGVSVDEAKATLIGQAEEAFDNFVAAWDREKPFCYWFGPTNVHRKWTAGSGKRLWGIDPDDLEGHMPPFLPDVPVVREDMADYLGEAMAFDAMLGAILDKLEATGEMDNTMIVISGDHGAPGFPRGKCNLYDFGTQVPLAISWPAKFQGDRVAEDVINIMDLAPTFLDAAGVDIPEAMHGKSLMPLLTSGKSGQIEPGRTWIVTGRERHVQKARADERGYPQRAIRTQDYLYICNFEPERWPMGDPYHVDAEQAPTTDALTNNTFVTFADLDASPTKAFLFQNGEDPKYKEMYDLAFAKRPEEELYILKDDPHQMNNLAYDDQHFDLKTRLLDQLMTELWRVEDPRVAEEKVRFEHPPFVPGE